MARDAERERAQRERRNERARAEGFTSYSQKYRGEKVNYRKGGAEYNAALDVAHGRARVARVDLGTKVVLSADRDNLAALMRATLREARKREK